MQREKRWPRRRLRHQQNSLGGKSDEKEGRVMKEMEEEANVGKGLSAISLREREQKQARPDSED